MWATQRQPKPIGRLWKREFGRSKVSKIVPWSDKNYLLWHRWSRSTRSLWFERAGKLPRCISEILISLLQTSCNSLVNWRFLLNQNWCLGPIKAFSGTILSCRFLLSLGFLACGKWQRDSRASWMRILNPGVSPLGRCNCYLFAGMLIGRKL